MQPPTSEGNQLSRLYSAVQLDDDSLNALRSLLSQICDFRKSTLAVQRIQAGSPGANRLGPVVRTNQSEFCSIANKCQQIFTRHSQFPGIALLRTRLDELQQSLSKGFDDSSKGYGERVQVLEKLNYENGTLRGVVEMIIEHHEYWKNKLAGQVNQPLARRLTFDAVNSQNATPSAQSFIGRHTLGGNPVATQQSTFSFSSTGASGPRIPSTASGTTVTQTHPLAMGSLPGSGPSLRFQFLPPSMSSTAVTQAPLLPPARSSLGIGQFSGLSSSGPGFQPSTTSGTVVTQAQPLRSSTIGSSLALSTACRTTVVQAQSFGSGPGLGFQTSPSTTTVQISSISGQHTTAVQQAQAPGGLFGTRWSFRSTPSFGPPPLASTTTGQQSSGGLLGIPTRPLPTGQGSGLGVTQYHKLASLQQAGSLGGNLGDGLSHSPLGHVQGGGLHLGSLQAPGTTISTTTGTQSQPQGGVNLSAPVLSARSQSGSSNSISVSAARGIGGGLVLGGGGFMQSSNAVTTSAPQRQSFLYIPRQPATGSPTGQETTTPSTEDTKVQSSQSSSENHCFSLNIDQAVHMCSGITDLWESKKHTDVTFLLQGARVRAHRIILASQSEYFDRLLFGEMREASEDEIQLSDVDNVEAFQVLMSYAYSGCVDIQSGEIQDALDVLKLSDRFGFELLKSTLGDKLTVAINMENILHLLAYADLYQVAGLLNECCAFIDQHAEDVLCSDAILTISDHVLMLILSRDSLCLSELLVFQTVIRWKESNQTSKEEMKGVLDCVRLTEIPPRILFGEVERSCLFEPESIMKALRAQNLLDFELMRPRGIKCTGINLMSDAQIAVNPSSGSNSPIATDHIVKLNLPHSHTLTATHLSRFSPCETLARVTLKQECLVNTIELESPPSSPHCVPAIAGDEMPTHNESMKKFSYKIYVSKDGKQWMKLFDYSEYSCHNIQKLSFPTLAFRMLQFELIESECQQLELKFLNCSFVEDHKPFKFRENGIIAPLFPLKPLAYQVNEATSDVIVVKLNQPYSVSMLSFKICGPVNSVADFRISNFSERSLNSGHLGEVKAHPFNEQLSVDFAEQVVISITIEIKNIKKVAPNSTSTPPGAVSTSQVQPVAKITSTDTSLKTIGQINRVGEQTYKIAGLTCQLKPVN